MGTEETTKKSVFQDAQRHTCIRLKCDKHGVEFIPMDTALDVVRLSHYDFEQRYIIELPDYPVRKAAASFLGATWLVVSQEARKRLNQLIGIKDDVPDYQFNHKESIMTKEGVAKAAAKKTTPPKAAAKPTKVAPPVKAKAAKVAAPVEKPAKVATAKAPTKAEKVAAPQATKVPGKGVARKPDERKFKLVETDKPRKGATAEFAEVAKGLKVFTRQQLFDAMTKKGGYGEQAIRTKIADMVYFNVVEEA